MNNFIKQIIEEKFVSKSQQRFFYAKANEKGSSKKEKEKWGKMAKEFSDKTNFKKIPNKVEKDVDEIVDVDGNIAMSKKPTDANTKGITSAETTDQVVKNARGQSGSYYTSGTQNYTRYWGESDMSKSLGFEKTMKQDDSYEEAKDHFEKDLGLDEPEAEERLNQMGYDKNLPDDKVRLVENPKKFMEEYIESIINKKNEKNNDILSKEGEIEEKEINPIVLKQLKSLKNTMDSNGLTSDDVLKHLK
jgi:hypothetical protein